MACLIHFPREATFVYCVRQTGSSDRLRIALSVSSLSTIRIRAGVPAQPLDDAIDIAPRIDEGRIDSVGMGDVEFERSTRSSNPSGERLMWLSGNAQTLARAQLHGDFDVVVTRRTMPSTPVDSTTATIRPSSRSNRRFVRG